jgi:NitT/TauT family transport system substrate-binding protein
MNNRFALIGALALLLGWTTLAATVFAETVVIAVPGPGSLTYLPVYLAKAIGADQAERFELKLRYVSGGPLALRDLQDKNSDFSVAGLAAIAAARADRLPVVAIAQLSQSAMYIFLLRSDLKNKVSSIAQLKGKRIGVTTGTTTGRSMGHMMMEYLIHRAGLKNSDVQFVSVGQNRETQSAALLSGTVDALMGDEPFSSELVARGIAVKLADLYLPENSDKLLGGPVVHAALATREEVLLQYPDTVKKVQRMFDRTLKWLAQHSGQEVIEKLSGQPGAVPEQSKLLSGILQRNHGMFPKFSKWDSKAVAITERFFHSTAIDPEEANLPFSSFVR